MGKHIDALFLYKVGQRVYDLHGMPLVVIARWRSGGSSAYKLIDICGTEHVLYQSSLYLFRYEHVRHTKGETPAEAAGEQEAQGDGRE